VETSTLAGSRVLLTGHTGFKGGWLAIWLAGLGAEVYGLSLDPPTQPNMFEAARVHDVVRADIRGDVRDLATVKDALEVARPDIVFHLAAQPLVFRGHDDPTWTFSTNVIGTMNVLEAVRSSKGVRAVVVVTTDHVYEINDLARPYVESDRLGGVDPYSASKASAELITACYRASYFRQGPWVATVRAGNVFGGGDWAAHRLVPDSLRALHAGTPISLRAPSSIRPWQHVLEPLSGYLQLAECLLGTEGPAHASAWNFGPDAEHVASVSHVASLISRAWGTEPSWIIDPPEDAPDEASMLTLDSSQARSRLGWRPRWSLEKGLDETVTWYRTWLETGDTSEVTRAQIAKYGPPY
jgi:CDP-glucose 4,6-dehydratase